MQPLPFCRDGNARKQQRWCFSRAIKASANFLLLSIWVTSATAQYAARKDGEVVRLEDRAHQIDVSIAPGVGNVAFEMNVKGQNVLFFPYKNVGEFKDRPRLSAIPFLGPWANRLDEQAFYANGKRYPFNMDLGNVRGAHPIHGFLSFTDKWQVTEVKANEKAAWVTSRLEFYREPSWMAQFPFAHTLEMTYRLANGVLEVNIKVHNLSSEPMPISIGFHPYYQLTDSRRDDWTISIGASKEWVLNSDKIPTGETVPITKGLTDPNRIALRDHNLDNVYGELVRDANGRASMRVKGKSQQLEISFGPKYKTAVVYAPFAPATGGGSAGQPQNPNFVCFEPMAGITDAMNLAHRGLYKDLQTLPPDQVWQESFWIHPSGF